MIPAQPLWSLHAHADRGVQAKGSEAVVAESAEDSACERSGEKDPDILEQRSRDRNPQFV